MFESQAMGRQSRSTVHFIAIADAVIGFPEAESSCGDCGCVVFSCRDKESAHSLVELYSRSVANDAVDLKIIPAASLSQSQIVLANRELQRAESIGTNLSSEEYRTSDPIFERIGRVALTLGELAKELEAVSFAQEPDFISESNQHADDSRNGDSAGTLHEALEGLERALDRHRLTFLFFATAKRQNEELRGTRHGMNECVGKEDVLGYDAVMKDIDSDGDFLFRHRSFFEQFADKAVAEFGPGKGLKPSGEESTHPYWSLEEGSASYLQETAEAILAAARTVEQIDTNHVCTEIIQQAADVAYDDGRSRWYSAVITKWNYLSRLDDTLADARRRIIWTSSSAPAVPDDSVDYWDMCFLGVKWDERIYNHDSVSCGTWSEDPNYLPVSNGTLYFYKCIYDVADQLLRLFTKSIRPVLSSDGETKVEVSFVLAVKEKLDPDEAFLIEEQIESISNQVHSRHHEWRVERGLVFTDDFIWQGEYLLKQKPPLGQPELKATFLFDRAERWYQRIMAPHQAPPASSEPKVEEPKSEEPKIDGAHPLLPTAVITAMALRDLARIAKYYPDAIATDETKKIFERLTSSLESAVTSVGLKQLFETIPVVPVTDASAEMTFNAMMACIVMHHKDTKLENVESKESQAANQQVFDSCVRDCEPTIRDIAFQLDRIKLFDCLIPNSEVNADFASPRRMVRLIETYWALLRRLIIHHAGAYATFRPHPLRLMLTSLKGRFQLAFERLQRPDLGSEGRDAIDSFIELLLDGDPDVFTVDENWTYQQLDVVDRCVERLRSDIGIGIFELTFAEVDFCKYAENAIAEYSERADKAWKKMLTRPVQRAPEKPISPHTEESSSAMASTTIAPKDLSDTKKLILRAVLELRATDEQSKVFAPQIAEKMGIAADNRLREELAFLRSFQLLGGQKGSRGYWLTKTGLHCVNSLCPKAPETVRTM